MLETIDPALLLTVAAALLVLSVLVTYLLVSTKVNKREMELAALTERLQGKVEELSALQGEISLLEQQASSLNADNTHLREQVVRL
ncbi:MAG: hypothetical protein KJN90_07220, partial [Gammaproteobacteria bacterium]|nr:hypothetical protein [Gammaproteobacteria bacterium]